jgi:N-dimethylarginine dimethylaminohydrolase
MRINNWDDDVFLTDEYIAQRNKAVEKAMKNRKKKAERSRIDDKWLRCNFAKKKIKFSPALLYEQI